MTRPLLYLPRHERRCASAPRSIHRPPTEGALTRLRAREAPDEQLFHAALNDPEVTEYLDPRYPVSRVLLEEKFASDPGSSFAHARFTIERKSDARAIGWASLSHGSPENRSATLGMVIGDRECWDSGYGTDATRAVCRFGFQQMNLHRIDLDVFGENQRALHVYEKLGFRAEALKRDAIFWRGRYQDIVVMGLLEGELR